MQRDLLDRLLTLRAAKRPAALVTDLESGDQAVVEADGTAGGLALGATEVAAVLGAVRDDRSGLDAEMKRFVQVFNPPLRLVVVGAVHIAQQLVPLAATAGYDVTVVDPRRAWASGERFPGIALVTDWPDEALRTLAPDHRTAIVTLTHDPKLDDPALAAALSSPAFYIGALGSLRTQARRLERLRAQGFEAAALARIHGPAGLDIGAKSPAEIAISILAQIIQVRRAAPGPAPAGAAP
ncbi:MAG TPA: XdhC family protein [Kiloniellales bacterium]